MATQLMEEKEFRRRLYIPTAVRNAELKLAALYREAARYDMDDILTYPELINRAWEREAEVARLEMERCE